MTRRAAQCRKRPARVCRFSGSSFFGFSGDRAPEGVAPRRAGGAAPSVDILSSSRVAGPLRCANRSSPAQRAGRSPRPRGNAAQTALAHPWPALRHPSPPGSDFARLKIVASGGFFRGRRRTRQKLVVRSSRDRRRHGCRRRAYRDVLTACPAKTEPPASAQLAGARGKSCRSPDLQSRAVAARRLPPKSHCTKSKSRSREKNHKKAGHCPASFFAASEVPQRASATSTPSSPCDRVLASPPCASLIRRRTSLAESA